MPIRVVATTRDAATAGLRVVAIAAAVMVAGAVGTKKEFCVCAAVILPDGRMALGHRHWNAMRAAADMGFTERITQDMQGFMTSTGRYVDRVEGMRLQLAAGIPTADSSRVNRYVEGGKLYSEDLY